MAMSGLLKAAGNLFKKTLVCPPYTSRLAAHVAKETRGSLSRPGFLKQSDILDHKSIFSCSTTPTLSTWMKKKLPFPWFYKFGAQRWKQFSCIVDPKKQMVIGMIGVHQSDVKVSETPYAGSVCVSSSRLEFLQHIDYPMEKNISSLKTMFCCSTPTAYSKWAERVCLPWFYKHEAQTGKMVGVHQSKSTVLVDLVLSQTIAKGLSANFIKFFQKESCSALPAATSTDKADEDTEKNTEGKGTNMAPRIIAASIFALVSMTLSSTDELSNLLKDITDLPRNNGVADLPRDSYEAGWEKVIDRPHLVAWQRPIPGTDRYEYKTWGTHFNVSGRAFYRSQWDLEFRRSWDSNVLKLEVIDKYPTHEVVRWVAKFPWPFNSREYIYSRKAYEDASYLAIISQSVEHEDFPLNESDNVRVVDYTSNMVIVPHNGTLDQPGFDYCLTYADDPKTNFSGSCKKWLAATAVPEFAGKLHDNAKRYEEKWPTERKTNNVGVGMGEHEDDTNEGEEEEKVAM